MKKLLLVFVALLPFLAHGQTFLSNNIYPNCPKDIDGRTGKFSSGVWVPFATTLEATTAVPITYRCEGLIVGIGTPGHLAEYWYKGGIADSNLVPKSEAGTITLTAMGAVPDGTTNNLTAINAAILTGKTVVIPEGDFMFNGDLLPLATGQGMYGFGKKSHLIMSGAHAGVTANEADIRNFRITGGGSGSMPLFDNPGAFPSWGVKAQVGCLVSGMTVNAIDGPGIWTTGVSNLVSGNNVYEATVGLCMSGEYSQASGNMFDGTSYGVFITTGNNLLSGCHLGDKGLYYNNQGNGDHSTVIGCTSNHTTPSIAVRLRGTGVGLRFIGCNFWYSIINFEDANSGSGNNGVEFSHCTFGGGTVFNHVSGPVTNCSIKDCFVENTVTLPNWMTLRNNDGSSGAQYPLSIDQIAPVLFGGSGTVNVPVKIDGTAGYLIFKSSVTP